MAESLFWRVFAHLRVISPGFAHDWPSGCLARFKDRMIAALDSSTIQLVLNCLDWARHRRHKAAAKLHMNLDVPNMLPDFAIVEDAAHHDSVRAEAARVEVDGRMMEMSFLTNNFTWSARSIAELYKARWAVELFFKELKQTCRLRDFVGYNENAVKWQIRVALLVHLLLRHLRFLSKWTLGFSRLAGVVRSALWVRRRIIELLELYGTASPGRRVMIVTKPLYLQPFLPNFSFPMGQQIALPPAL